MGYRSVLNTINCTDPDTAYLVVEDKDGKRQTIVSDSRHPYFAQYGDDPTPPAHRQASPTTATLKTPTGSTPPTLKQATNCWMTTITGRP